MLPVAGGRIPAGPTRRIEAVGGRDRVLRLLPHRWQGHVPDRKARTPRRRVLPARGQARAQLTSAHQRVRRRRPVQVDDDARPASRPPDRQFDRLEVADFSARAVIDTLAIGKLVPIGPDEVKELEAKFLS